MDNNSLAVSYLEPTESSIRKSINVENFYKDTDPQFSVHQMHEERKSMLLLTPSKQKVSGCIFQRGLLSPDESSYILGDTTTSPNMEVINSRSRSSESFGKRNKDLKNLKLSNSTGRPSPDSTEIIGKVVYYTTKSPSALNSKTTVIQKESTSMK